MRGTELLDKMGLVDAAYVAEAEAEPIRNRFVWLRWGALASCAVLVAAICIWYQPHGTEVLWAETGVGTDTVQPETEIPIETDPPVVTPSLPMLTISDDMNGMGFEGYMAYDISDLVSANPWYEGCGLITLPVYENAAQHQVENRNPDTMYALLANIAGRFGVEPGEVTFTDNTPDADTRKQYVEGMKEKFGLHVTEASMISSRIDSTVGGHRVTIEHYLCAKIFLENEIPLPAGYSAKSDVYEDQVALAEYYLETYPEWIGFENPQIDISMGDYNIYNDRNFSIGFYEKGENLTEDIVNYNFRGVRFSCNDEGNLYLLRIDEPDLSYKVGDYPIISVEEATVMLREGQYITTVPYTLEEEDAISRVELVYRNAPYDQYFMPYYRFYVELPDFQHAEYPDLKNYGAYYVPAVEGQYIENMPVWDGRFN